MLVETCYGKYLFTLKRQLGFHASRDMLQKVEGHPRDKYPQGESPPNESPKTIHKDASWRIFLARNGYNSSSLWKASHGKQPRNLLYLENCTTIQILYLQSIIINQLFTKIFTR